MSKLDKIIIEGLEASCIVGVLDDERLNKQPIIIDAELSVDLSKASASDDIKDTLDYFSVYKNILMLAENSDFYLIEKLAQAIADECLRSSEVEEVRVKVKKPAALKQAESVAVEIIRNKT